MTWPDVDDLLMWLRAESIEPSSGHIAEASFDAAVASLRRRIDPDMLAVVAADDGVDVDDPVAYAAYCPADVRQAILIRAASLFTRRDSTNGSISFGEFAVRVAKLDPDVTALMACVRSVEP